MAVKQAAGKMPGAVHSAAAALSACLRWAARLQAGAALAGALSALAWLCGIAWQLQQPALWPVPRSGAVLVVALACSAACWRWRRHLAAALALAAMVGLAGASITMLRAAAQQADVLAAELEGQDIVVTGVIAELPRRGANGTRYPFEVESATLRGAPVRLPQTVALGWYRTPDDESWLSGPGEDLRAGQRWRHTVRLKQPHGTLNPHGFDAELWMFERGLGASGSVRAGAGQPATLLDANAGHPVERLRQQVRDAIERRVTDPLAAGVLAALAIGDQAAIDREGWDLFRITGVAHLMSISGLHVTMFAWLAGGLVQALWRRHPRLPLRLPAPQAGRWGGLAAAAGYAVLAGWGVPAQRTVAMIAAVVLLRSAGLRWPLHALLLAAAVVVSALDPWALLQPGFWLSFGAVGLLAASEPVHSSGAPAPAGWGGRLWQAAKAGLRTQAVATVGLAPMTLVFFQQLSIVGFAANLVAIPLVTLVITPLALLGVLLPPLWSLDAAIVQALVALLRHLAGWPLAVWQAAAAPPWAMACGLLAGLLAVMPLPWRLRWLALPLLLPLLMPPVPRPPPGAFELVAADIGQGTAVLVRTHAHLLVFDTGPAFNAESDAGARVLLPLLRGRGETRLDVLMLSHRDSDHVGGAATLLAALPVARLDSSLEDGHPLRRPGLPHRRCEAGQSWTWDGVHFLVLHPTPAEHAAATRPNAVSCVLRVQGAGGSVLITGDIEAAQEAALVDRARSQLPSDVLLVPHHGSRTSSTPAFLDAVAPRTAVVQAGYRSRYGHPAPDVMARYEARGIAIVRSDRCGAWMLDAAGGAACWRETARRYWHYRVPA